MLVPPKLFTKNALLKVSHLLEIIVKFDYIWWGYVAATDDKMPHVYELAPGVLSWTGCNGRGVALATALGRELAKASNGTPLCI